MTIQNFLANVKDDVAGWGKNIGSRLRDAATAVGQDLPNENAFQSAARGWNGDPTAQAATVGPAEPAAVEAPAAPAVEPTPPPAQAGMRGAAQPVAPAPSGQPATPMEPPMPPEPSPVTGKPNPAWGEGKSPEAKAWEASRAGAPPSPPPPGGPPAAGGGSGPPPNGPNGPNGPGRIQRGLNAAYDAIPGGKYVQKLAQSKWGGRLGAAGLALGAVNTYDKVDAGETPEQRDGRTMLGMSPDVRGAVAEGSNAALFGYGRQMGTALGAGAAGFVQGHGLRGRVVGALKGAGQGWTDAGNAEDAAAKPPGTPAAAPPVQQGVETGTIPGPNDRTANPASPEDSAKVAEGMRSSLRGGSTATMPGFINGQQYEVPKGGGVIADDKGNVHGFTGQGQYGEYGDGANRLGDRALPKNATPEQAQAWIRNHNALAQINEAQADARDRAGMRGGAQAGGDDIGPLRALAGQGPFGAMAALGAYGALDRMKLNSANLGLRAQQNQYTHELAMKRMEYDMGKDARDNFQAREDIGHKQFDTDIENYVKGQNPAGKSNLLGKLDPADEERNKQQAAALKSDMEHTLGDTPGAPTIGHLDQTHKAQLFMGANMRAAVTKARGTNAQAMADFFGNKRVDSRNLYSYMPAPAGAEGTIIPFSGGIKVKMMNGNMMTIRGVMGGGQNLFSPNDPVDADIVALLKPQLEAYYKSQGKK